MSYSFLPKKKGPYCYLLVRDAFGKYAWHSQLKWIPNNQTQPPLPPHQTPKVTTPFAYQKTGKKIDDSDFNEVFTFLKEKSEELKLTTICNLSQKQETLEDSYLKQTKSK